MGKGLIRSLSRGLKSRQEFIKERYGFSGLIINVNAASTNPGFGTGVIADFPEGNLLFFGAGAYVSFTGPSSSNLVDTWSGDYSVATTPLTDTNISATSEQNIISKAAIGPAVSEVITRARGVRSTSVVLNNTDNSLELNLNLTIDGSAITNNSNVDITCEGELFLCYTILGDD